MCLPALVEEGAQYRRGARVAVERGRPGYRLGL
jgi:hypothetical protein